MTGPSLFPELDGPPPLPPLRDPVEHFIEILRDDRRFEAVVVRLPDGAERWVPRSVIRFDGLGGQMVRLERWKAREIGL